MIQTATMGDSVANAYQAFLAYRNLSYAERAKLLNHIADALASNANDLIAIAAEETNLNAARLKTELNRTCFQLRSYGEAAAKGLVFDNTIDVGTTGNSQVNIDIRKTVVPIGVVAVFGASNFPFAYSAPGGDTASALAAGCTVVIKPHPAHFKTSLAVAKIMKEVLAQLHLPGSIITHLEDASTEAGIELVKHPLIKAVGFTGSLNGGKALYDIAQQRVQPIPVFAEMGSVNPVFLFPNRLAQSAPKYVGVLAGAITGSVGQFCTQPGIIVGIDSPALEQFKSLLVADLNTIPPAKMLHQGIADSFAKYRQLFLDKTTTELLTKEQYFEHDMAIPTLIEVSAADFINDNSLQHEVFGPVSLLVRCANEQEMVQIAYLMKGQLTTTIVANHLDVEDYKEAIHLIAEVGGRVIWNGVPTGVEVCLSMHHGGDFPATTDSRFTAVGADAIKRWGKIKCYQNFPQELLPPPVQNKNSWQIWRRINNEYSKSDLD
jgi:alpha-ketoglutaric semialdehyde dehydrogenase